MKSSLANSRCPRSRRRSLFVCFSLYNSSSSTTAKTAVEKAALKGLFKTVSCKFGALRNRSLQGILTNLKRRSNSDWIWILNFSTWCHCLGLECFKDWRKAFLEFTNVLSKILRDVRHLLTEKSFQELLKRNKDLRNTLSKSLKQSFGNPGARRLGQKETELFQRFGHNFPERCVHLMSFAHNAQRFMACTRLPPIFPEKKDFREARFESPRLAHLWLRSVESGFLMDFLQKGKESLKASLLFKSFG